MADDSFLDGVIFTDGVETEFVRVLGLRPKASLDRNRTTWRCRGTGIRSLVVTATAPYDVKVLRNGNPTASRDRTRAIRCGGVEEREPDG